VSSVRVGEVLAGKYEVERVLGQGGMGVVVAARHVQLGQRVALKFLLQEACYDEHAVERFLREARAVVQIRGEHVARVSDVGTLESGAPYIVMEYLEGRDLSELLQQRGALPITEAIGYVLQACEAIAQAHALHIVHRDLKPANLFLTTRPDGSPLIKVLDFGISKTMPQETDAPSPALTSSFALLGSPLYLSPEQIRTAREVDPRSDIWSLGVILHELVTNQAPFMAESLPAVLAMIIADPPVKLRSARPDAPPALEAVIERCLAKDRSQRFPDLVEFVQALVPFGPAESALAVQRIARILGRTPSVDTEGAVLAVTPAPNTERPRIATPEAVAHTLPQAGTPIETPGLSQSTDSGWGQTRNAKRRTRTPIYLLGGVAALLLVLIVVVLQRRAGRSATPALSATALVAAPPNQAEPTTLPTPSATAAPLVVAEPTLTPLVQAPASSAIPRKNTLPASSPQHHAAQLKAHPVAGAAPAKDLFDDTK